MANAGFRIALTRAGSSRSEWESVLTTTGQLKGFRERHGEPTSSKVMEFLLSDRENPASIISMVKAARDNARAVRIALTSEVWEAINESWMTLDKLLSDTIAEADLPDVLTTIRQQNALVRGATNGTMLRNDACETEEVTLLSVDGATGVCGSSAEGIGGCQFNRTWAQAEAVCVSSGARLCTQVELVPATAGRGCGHERS